MKIAAHGKITKGTKRYVNDITPLISPKNETIDNTILLRIPAIKANSEDGMTNSINNPQSKSGKINGTTSRLAIGVIKESSPKCSHCIGKMAKDAARVISKEEKSHESGFVKCFFLPNFS